MRQSHRVPSISVLPAFLMLTNPAFRIYNARVSTSLPRIITPTQEGMLPLLPSLPCLRQCSVGIWQIKLTKQSTPSHTLISRWKLLETPARAVAAEGYSERLAFVKGNKHPFRSAANGEDAEPSSALSHHLGTLFVSLSNRELISCGLSSLKPHTVQMQLRLDKNN